MRKSESIYKLEETGLNTLDYFISKDWGEILHYLAKHRQDFLSMRTERGSEFQCPYFYNMTGDQLWDIARKNLGLGYTLLFSPCLDTKGCIAFGTIGLGENNPDMIEVVFGPGKVRELDNHPNKLSLVIPKGRMKAIIAGEHELIDDRIILLNTLFKQVKDSLYDEIPCIVEWSWYEGLVGRLGRHEIFWEIRGNV